MSLTTTSLSPFLATEGSGGIVYAPTECTVAQAMEFLRTSERHLNDLLDAGRIAFRQEGGERMVQWNSLRAFEHNRERKHAAVDRIVRMSEEMGLYDD